MVKRTSYEHGTPSWIDLATPDVAAAQGFYGALFGWGFDAQPIPEGGEYVLCTKGGESVAGMMQQAPDDPIPPHWSSYVTVDDLEATVAKVEPAGGQVLAPPMDVMDAGRMAVITDPTGAALCLWHAKEHIGAGLVNEHGTLTWNELLSPDVEAAAAFYEQVLGWTSSDPGMGGDGPPYTMFSVGDLGIAGAMPPPMEGIPAVWTVYFAVDDCDATVAAAEAAGATVLAPPMDIPVGRMAVLSDPNGAMFNVIRMTDAPT
jgi:predicted enzyme related to lactoylglutathione lyase